VPGYEEFLEVIFEPGHEEHAHYVRWAGGPSPSTARWDAFSRRSST
jgi:hypothetical protein